MLSRLYHGARVSLLLGIISVSIGVVFGVPMGIVAGYFGGRVDLFIMGLIDVMLAFPSILLAILMVAFLGPELRECHHRHWCDFDSDIYAPCA
jgi:ABC-type dipeptide/oligopeptide/nickel transport system permease subunit